MKPCILFLDIDGVLNSGHWFDANKTGSLWLPRCPELDPQAVALLNRIVDRTGCQVVLSSSWRIRGYEMVERWLMRAGFQHTLEGFTPHLDGHDRRGDEVQLWLQAEGRGRPYVLLDDEPEANHPGRWVATSYMTGLTDELADMAIHLLTTRTP